MFGDGAAQFGQGDVGGGVVGDKTFVEAPIEKEFEGTVAVSDGTGRPLVINFALDDVVFD